MGEFDYGHPEESAERARKFRPRHGYQHDWLRIDFGDHPDALAKNRLLLTMSSNETKDEDLLDHAQYYSDLTYFDYYVKLWDFEEADCIPQDKDLLTCQGNEAKRLVKAVWNQTHTAEAAAKAKLEGLR